jgi:hypothetical protein
MYAEWMDSTLRIGDHDTEVVDGFVYLGSCITRDNDEYTDIQR